MPLCSYILPVIARASNRPWILRGVASLENRVVSSSATLFSTRGLVLTRDKSSLPKLTGLSIYRFHSKSCSIGKAMEKYGVVPDVIPCPPEGRAEVSYKCGASVDEGNCLTPTEVKNEPTITWKYQPDALYTVCMTDPDAPSRKDPKFREWHHWLVGNIPDLEVCNGEVLSAYVGAGPPKDTGLHRYVFLVYKQPCKINFDENRLTNTSADGRGGFKIVNFAKKYNLGSPIAGNFFQAKYDDYVPILYKQLGA